METHPKHWVARHQLLSFFSLTYLITYAVALYSRFVSEVTANSFFFYVMIFGPTIAAFAVAAAADGLRGLRNLLSGFTRLRFHAGWVLAALSLTLTPLLIVLVYSLSGGSAPGLVPEATAGFLLQNLLYTLINGPVAEETGWRGFALPRLQRRFGALTSSLVLGVVWAFWHLPYYFISAGRVGIPFPIYVVMVVALSVFITWIYNNTPGNLALCILAHFCFNFNSAFIAGFLGLMPAMLFYIVCGAALGVYIVIILLKFKAKNLSRRADATHVGEVA